MSDLVPSANLDLKIGASRNMVPAEAFADVVKGIVAILHDLQSANPSKRQVTWYVTDLRMGSIEATITAEDLSAESFKVGKEFVRGLQTAEDGRSLPEYFSLANVKRLTRLARPLSIPGVEYIEVKMSMNGTSVEARATKVIKTNLEKLQIPRRRSLGSITGVLDTISTRAPAKFQVLDPVSRRPVSCEFPESQVESIKDALSRRVTVSGVIVRNINGQPLRIEGGQFEILEVAPLLTNLVGIDPDYTDGLTLPDYFDHID